MKTGTEHTIFKVLDTKLARDFLRMLENDCPREYGLSETDKCLNTTTCIDCWANALNAGNISSIYSKE